MVSKVSSQSISRLDKPPRHKESCGQLLQRVLKVALVALLGAGNGLSRASACAPLTSVSFPYESLGTTPGLIFVSRSTAYKIGKIFTLEQHQRNQKEVAELCRVPQYVEKSERVEEERSGIMIQNTGLSTTAYCAIDPERLPRYREAIYRSGSMITPSQTEVELTEAILTLHSLIIQGKETPSSYRITLTPDLMSSFIQELKAGLRDMQYRFEFDVIGFAARMHQKLINTRPFFDGQGRLARLLMNHILKVGGYPPVVFFSRDEYVDAIRIDQARTQGEDGQIGVHFAQFLREIIQQNQQKRTVLDCLLSFPESGQKEQQNDKEFQTA